MSKEFFSTDLRTRAGILTLRMIDQRDSPTALELSYPVEDPVRLRWGESRSSGYGDAVVGSFADIEVPDPQGHFQRLFGTEFDELDFKVVIEGTIEQMPFRWEGRIQQSQFDRPVSQRVQTDTKVIRVYDRIGALGDKQPVVRSEIFDVEELLMRLLFPAQPDVDILYDIDVEGDSFFDGSDVPPRDWFPTTRKPSTREVGDTDDQEDEGIGGSSKREQLVTLAERLGLKVWHEPFTGAFHVVPRFKVGEEITEATRITSNGYPLDPDASPSFDRSATIPSLGTEKPPLRSEDQDRFETVQGVKSVTVDIEDAPLVKNPHFKLYEYRNTDTNDLGDFVADFPFWLSGDFVQKIQALYQFSNFQYRSQGIANDFIGLSVDDTTNQPGIISQLTRAIPDQDIPVKGRLKYQAIPSDPNDQPSVFVELEYKSNTGTVDTVSTSDLTPLTQFADPNVPTPKFIETPLTRNGGQWFIFVSGNHVYFKVVDFEIVVENEAGDNLVVSSLEISPTGDKKGRKEVSISDDTFYFVGDALRLKNPLGDTSFVDNFEKEVLPTVQPLDWSSPRFGRNYENLYEYRAVARLAQQPPGTDSLATKVVPGILTPGRSIEMEEGRLIFAGGRTVHLTGEETGTTDLNDIFVPDSLTDPIGEQSRPQAPQITLDSFATYEAVADTVGQIDGYKLFRREKPGEVGTLARTTNQAVSPAIIGDSSPQEGMNLHVARAYNDIGDSPPSNEVLQLPPGWYVDGDPEFSPAPIPQASTGHSPAVRVGDHIYIFGGEDSGGVHARSYKYNLWTDTWTQLPDYPEGPTTGLFAVLDPINEKIVVGGGQNDIGTNQPHVHRWDPDSGSWSSYADLVKARAFPAAGFGTSGGRGYIVLHGGDDNGNAKTATVQRIDLQQPSWQTLSDAPFADAKHGAHFNSSSGQMYFYGGEKNPAALHRFSIAQDQWQSLSAPPPQPVHSYGLAYSAILEAAFLVGGKGPSESEGNFIQRYNVTSNSWSIETRVPTPRGAARSALIDPYKTIFTLGGSVGGGSFGLNEVHVLGVQFDNQPPGLTCDNYVVSGGIVNAENQPPMLTCEDYDVQNQLINPGNQPPVFTCDNYTYKV